MRRACAGRRGRSRTRRRRRRATTTPARAGRRPLGESPLGLLLERRSSGGRWHRRPDRRAAARGRAERVRPDEMPTSSSRRRRPAPGSRAAPADGPSGACRRAASRPGRRHRPPRARAAVRCRRASAGAASRPRRRSGSPPWRRARRRDLAVGRAVLDARRASGEPRSTTRVACAPVMIVGWAVAPRRLRGTRDRCSTACRRGWWSAAATRRRSAPPRSRPL